ncbi:hypothetical protein GIB67_032783 [Kingdonia uniflora]|uniref:Lipase n=1 Tax=Kingdonia uniflora TaxID=39325 RepID=A0A7J7MWB5_9MAGN|nr:hypothetical protein GIB67_032783 [Kingdonia uniflora]
MEEDSKRAANHLNMAKTLICIFLVFIFCGSSLGARPKLFPYPSAKVAANDGICSLRVEIYGYTCEEHTVTTQDGYIISIQRIPVGLSGGTSGDRPPVLLQHGVLMDGITWLLNSPDESLAFILADNGFDVWIANTRGTKYSRGHTSLSPDDDAYWDWTWDQLVIYELPALFQYVQGQTSQKLHYVGHSLGTLLALTSFSQNKLLDMLRSAALLSPIAYIGQMYSKLARTAAEDHVAEALYKSGFVEFDPNSKVVNNLLKVYCEKPGVDCYNMMTVFTGSAASDHKCNFYPCFLNWRAVIRNGTLTMYDYGDDDGNKQHYGQTTAPGYDIANIPHDVPLFLSYGGADALSDVNDVQILLSNLKDHDQDKLVVQYQADYAHADFVMAVNAKQLVYDPLVAFFQLY